MNPSLRLPIATSRYSNTCLLLAAIAVATTDGAAYGNGLLRVHEILSTLSRIVVPTDKILDDSQVRQLHAPTSPLADASDAPATEHGQILAPSAPERVSSVWVRVDTDVE